jgi:hypothetical protein
MTLTTGRDTNGNSLLRIKMPKYRAFSIQVNGNPLHDIYLKARDEKITDNDRAKVRHYIRQYGTEHQRTIIGKDGKSHE